MRDRAIVVIGASAGGVEALQRLVSGLDRDFAGSILIVLHIPPFSRSVLPSILERAGPLPSGHAVDGEPMLPGYIHIAPPDCHMLIDDARIVLQRGPIEHGSRPAADPLFRAAAQHHGRRVTGVVLSGTLHDGTAGLLAIRRAGGVTLVQDPAEAQYDGMPASAIAAGVVDRVLEAGAIAAALNEAARAPSVERNDAR